MRALSSIIVILFLGGVRNQPSVVRAAMQGDKENLRMVMAKYRENLDRLRTWKGKVLRTNRPMRDSAEILVENRIEFAYDARSGRYRYNITTLRDVSLVEGKEVSRLTPVKAAGLFNKDSFYDIIYQRDSDGFRIANVRAKKKMDPGWHAETFEALFFFTDKGKWQDEHLKVLADNFDSPAVIGSVMRDGDTITMTRVIRKNSVEKTFSLAKGGNATRITTTENRPDGSERVSVDAWDWENVQGVWVPKSAQRQVRDSAKNGERDDTSLKWEENLVNVSLEEKEFALASLGLRQGDFIEDARTNRKMIARGAEFPPGASKPKETRGGWLYLVLLNVIVIAIIAAGLFMYSRRKKRRA
jgi:hypothetical protein